MLSRTWGSFASVVAFEDCTRAQLSNMADSTLSRVCSCERRLFFIVASMARRTPNASTARSTVATMGQTQICRFRNTPVRETVRPILLDAQVILGVREFACDREEKSDFNQFISTPPPTSAE